MKKVYFEPVIVITLFESEETLTTSGVVFGGDTGAPKGINYTEISKIFEP